jgi:hypothetical protein
MERESEESGRVVLLLSAKGRTRFLRAWLLY